MGTGFWEGRDGNVMKYIMEVVAQLCEILNLFTLIGEYYGMLIIS